MTAQHGNMPCLPKRNEFVWVFFTIIIIMTVFFSSKHHYKSMETFKHKGKTKTQFRNLAERGREKKRLACKRSGISLPVSTAEKRLLCICACIHLCTYTHTHTHTHTIQSAFITCPFQRAAKVVRPERTTVSRQQCLGCERYQSLSEMPSEHIYCIINNIPQYYSTVFVAHFNKLHA